ncbi:MAG: pantoate--beta-alanine ligase, partial [Bacteroidota bacterium]
EIDMQRVPTKREVSGLAMSSRNMRLTKNGLETAAAIYRSLSAVIVNLTDIDARLAFEKQKLTSLGFDVEYLSCVSLPFMDEVSGKQLDNQSDASKKGKYAVVFAGSLEGVRLIDNLVF